MQIEFTLDIPEEEVNAWNAMLERRGIDVQAFVIYCLQLGQLVSAMEDENYAVVALNMEMGLCYEIDTEALRDDLMIDSMMRINTKSHDSPDTKI